MAHRIAAAGSERIDELQPLWLQLHHDAQRVSPRSTPNWRAAACATL
jgi:hypothetical protein